jgi:hypothetical protein
MTHRAKSSVTHILISTFCQYSIAFALLLSSKGVCNDPQILIQATHSKQHVIGEERISSDYDNVAVKVFVITNVKGLPQHSV